MDYALAAAGVAVAVLAAFLLYRSLRRRSSMSVLEDIVRDVGFVVARDPALGESELLDVTDGVLVVRAGTRTLRLPLTELVKVHLQYEGEQRQWHYGQLVAEATRVAGTEPA